MNLCYSFVYTIKVIFLFIRNGHNELAQNIQKLTFYDKNLIWRTDNLLKDAMHSSVLGILFSSKGASEQ
jgi:hypothetical protein